MSVPATTFFVKTFHENRPRDKCFRAHVCRCVCWSVSAARKYLVSILRNCGNWIDAWHIPIYSFSVMFWTVVSVQYSSGRRYLLWLPHTVEFNNTMISVIPAQCKGGDVPAFVAVSSFTEIYRTVSRFSLGFFNSAPIQVQNATLIWFLNCNLIFFRAMAWKTSPVALTNLVDQ